MFNWVARKSPGPTDGAGTPGEAHHHSWFAAGLKQNPRVQAGASKLPGLFEVPRHSGVRTLLASYKPRRTPSASKSLV